MKYDFTREMVTWVFPIKGPLGKCIFIYGFHFTTFTTLLDIFTIPFTNFNIFQLFGQEKLSQIRAPIRYYLKLGFIILWGFYFFGVSFG